MKILCGAFSLQSCWTHVLTCLISPPVLQILRLFNNHVYVTSCLLPQNTITLPPGVQLPPGAVIVKNEQGQYMVVSGQLPQVQQQQHIQQQPGAILSQQFKFNTVRVCTTIVMDDGITFIKDRVLQNFRNCQWFV